VHVSVIILTHNEAQALGRVLAELSTGLVTEVVVVDSNSTNGTAEVAESMGARVVREPRPGYRRACFAGLAAANASDVVVLPDGDYCDRSDVPPLSHA
jgi:glycosyltransferase involved in cell wall biosynthesis